MAQTAIHISKPTLRRRMYPVVVLSLCVLCVGVGRRLGGHRTAAVASTPTAKLVLNPDNLESVLNDLKSAINAQLDFHNGYPRAEMGPCGPLAREFCEAWNERFEPPVRIAFVMSHRDGICRHVLVHRQNDLFFDLGRGSMTRAELTLLYGENDPSVAVEVMDQFDEAQFLKNSLPEPYYDCPGYSKVAVREIIEARLDRLKQVP